MNLNLKKILKKSPVRNAWAAMLKNADFSQSSLKVTKTSKFLFLFKIPLCLHY